MIHTIIYTILIYSTITFIISLITDNEYIDRILAYGIIGMFIWLIFYPIRAYSRNGFYVCEFQKDGKYIDSIYVRGGEKSYNMLKEKYPQDEYDCISRKIYFKKYFKGKYLERE